MLVRESFPSVPLQASRWGGLVGAVACGEQAANIPSAVLRRRHEHRLMLWSSAVGRLLSGAVDGFVL